MASWWSNSDEQRTSRTSDDAEVARWPPYCRDHESIMATLGKLDTQVQQQEEGHDIMMRLLENIHKKIYVLQAQIPSTPSAALAQAPSSKPLTLKPNPNRNSLELADDRGSRTPPRQRRNDRPRSGSCPPTSDDAADRDQTKPCGWHSHGNMDKRSLQGIALNGMEIIQHPDNLGQWQSHIDSTLFWNRTNFSGAIVNSLTPPMLDGVAELLCHRTGSANNRKFIIRCRTCNTCAAILYGPNDTEDDKHRRLQQVLQFLRVSKPKRFR